MITRICGGLCVLWLGALSGCQSAAAGDAKPKQRAVTVSVAEVQRRDVPVEVKTIGTVEAASTVAITAQVTGLLFEVHFKEGDVVKRGDLMFSIDTRPYSAQVAAAQAELQKNQALADQARTEADRYEKMAAEGVATEQELARARANAQSLNATLRANRADIASAALNVQFAKIRAPMDGRTGTLLVHPGNLVRANETTPLTVIRSLSPAFVRFSVPQEYLPRLQTRLAQQALPVKAVQRGEGGKTAMGSVTFLENAVDAATGTISLKAEFPNTDQALWPGALVDVSLQLDIEKGATVVPEAAVQEGQDGPYSFVVTNGDKVVLRSVEVKQTTPTEVVVARGLTPGERVVTEGHMKLREGSLVTIKPPSAGASSARDEEARDQPAAETGAAPAPSSETVGAVR